MTERREPEDIVLEQCRTIAVVGLSSDPNRDSYRVIRYMQEQGYRIIPVNPNEPGPIFGQRVYPNLKAIPGPIDLVNVFRRSNETDEAIDGAIAIGAKAIWLQLGIRNAAGLERATAAGLLAVEYRCLMVEHQRWRGVPG